MRRVIGLLIAGSLWSIVDAQTAGVLRQTATITLPEVSGRIDHLAFDASRQRVLVAALGNNTVEVVDAAKNTHLRSIPGFHKPQGIAVVPELGAFAVANGDTGTLQFIDAETFATRWTTSVGDDADNVRYDATARRLYVAAQGGLYSIDPTSGKVVGRIAIDGHPESFQLEMKGPGVYANLPGLLSSQVIASDRRTMSVAAEWSLFGDAGNYPMSLDEGSSRLFVGFRRPAKLVLLDTKTGKSVGAVAVVGDTDDLFFDGIRQRIYVIGGEGFVDIVRRQGDSLERIDRLATRSGARTGLWVTTLNRLYVAVPAQNGLGAEVRVFEAR